MSNNPYTLAELTLSYPFHRLAKLHILFSLTPAPQQECNFAEHSFLVAF